MGTGTVLVVLIAVPVVFSAALLFWAPEEWLKGFAILARSFGTSM
jgi:hypothetical protein